MICKVILVAVLLKSFGWKSIVVLDGSCYLGFVNPERVWNPLGPGYPRVYRSKEGMNNLN